MATKKTAARRTPAKKKVEPEVLTPDSVTNDEDAVTFEIFGAEWTFLPELGAYQEMVFGGGEASGGRWLKAVVGMVVPEQRAQFEEAFAMSGMSVQDLMEELMSLVEAIAGNPSQS